MKIPADAFASAARAAQKSGAKFPLKPGETLDAMLKRMQPLFFDATVDPIVTNKTPGSGKDILQESANNLYVGATMKDLEGFKERYALNSRVVKRTASWSKRCIGSADATTRKSGPSTNLEAASALPRRR